MEYTQMKKLGDAKISKLGFGAMRFPALKSGNIDQVKVQEMIDYAMLAGVNYFDTAAVYGDGKNEAALGKALQKFDRSLYQVANKMPFWLVNNVYDADRLWERSLENMQLENFDFYLMHSLSRASVDRMKFCGGIKWASNKKRDGKIKNLGFSIHADDALLAEVLELHDWDFVQIQYNYLDTDDRPGQKGFERLVERGIPVIIMEPLKGGILANLAPEISEPFDHLNGGAPASYSFRWLAEQAGIATILSGMSTLEQVRENVITFQNLKPLSVEEHDAIQTVRGNILRTQKVPCTGCNYCQPCPCDVKIPSHFKTWNTMAMRHSQWVSGTEIDVENAKKCTRCGECSKVCPQGIDVPAKIQEMILNRGR